VTARKFAPSFPNLTASSALWLLAPFLYIPGMTVIGDWVYENVASRRMRCGDGACRI
jgi:hypothetical protein